MRFLKGHGTENDFVLLPDPDGALDLTSRLVSALCDRRAGVGGDGVLRVVRADAAPEAAGQGARWFMDYRNADGSVAEMCGNGVRVFGRYLVDAGLEQPGTFLVATRDGAKTLEVPAAGDVTVDMGTWQELPDAFRVAVGERHWPAAGVTTGNPHVVAVVDRLDDAGPLTAGPRVTPAGPFPTGVNVEFVVDRGPGHVAMRVHERGVGETRSCGTGACAVVAATVARHGDPLPATYTVDVPGGRLRVTATAERRLLLAGPAVLVADGELRDEWVAAAR